MSKNIYDWLSKLCDANKDRIFFLRQKETYSDLLRDVKKRAVTLVENLKVKKGDTVAILSNNTPEFIKSYFAIMSVGAKVLMLDTGLTKDEHKTMMDRTDCRLALAMPEYFVGGSAKMYDIETVDETEVSDFKAVAMTLEDTAQLSFTSGTTGNPKIVDLTHGNLVSLASGVEIYKSVFRPDYIIYGFLPLYHIYGVVINIIGPLQMKCSLLLQPVLKPAEFLKDFQEYRPHVFPAVPRVLEGFYKKIIDGVKEKKKLTLFRVILGVQRFWKMIGLGFLVKKVQKPVHDIFGGHMKLLVSAGATLKPKIRAFYENLGFVIGDCYGLTETTGPANFNMKFRAPDGKIRYAGPLPGGEIEIRNADKRGIGDIWVKGSLVMRGYLNNVGANAESFDKKGWFKTGDVGTIDKRGVLTIKGRKKQLIVLDSGKNVYPDELEELYMMNPDILAAAVFERKIKGKTIPYAVFQVNPGVTVAQVKNMVRISNLIIAPYKWVTQFAITEEELPQTSAKKIRHHLIAKMIESGEYPNRNE